MAKPKPFSKGNAAVLIGTGLALWVWAALMQVLAGEVAAAGVVFVSVLGLLGALFVALGILPLVLKDRRAERPVSIQPVDILPVQGGGYLLDTGKPGGCREVPGVFGRRLLLARPDSLPFLKADATVWSRVINADDIPDFSGDDLGEMGSLESVAERLSSALVSASPDALAVIACRNPQVLLPALRLMEVDRPRAPARGGS